MGRLESSTESRPARLMTMRRGRGAIVKESKMTEILITGGGLAGLNIAREFARSGTPVVITIRQINSRIEKILGEYRDLITVESINLARGGEVFDLFSRYGFRGVIHTVQAHQQAQTRAANRANYDMLFNCLEAADTTGTSRFIHVSSIAVYSGMAPPLEEEARFPSRPVLDEDPDTFCFADLEDNRILAVPAFETTVKRALELIVLDYASPMQMGLSAALQPNQRFRDSKMDVAVVRFSTQFGPGYTNMGSPISRAVHTLAGRDGLMEGTGYGGMPLVPLWNRIAIAPLLYVRDTASALVRMMQAEQLAHQVYNLSSGYTTSPREQLLALYRIAPNAADLLHVDPEALRAEPYRTGSFNANLLQQDIGWTSGFSFEQAVEDYIRWLQDHPY